jgi:hypothetical protein
MQQENHFRCNHEEHAMDLGHIEDTHPLYDMFAPQWRFMRAAYEGAAALVRMGAITRHERESERNFRRRLQEVYTLNYSRGIVDLFSHYLFRKPARRDLGPLANDPLWLQFADDCDLWGSNFEVFLLEQQRVAAIMGHAGILVDKHAPQDRDPAGMTRAQEIEEGLYPYLCAYTPLDILHWEHGRDRTGRPFLRYLKLREQDGLYRIWRPDSWETWQAAERGAQLVERGHNPLGEIPFVWLHNLRSLEHRGVGHSDLADIAAIDLSILRNLSQCEEVMGLAGFPMMRKPMREPGDTAPDLTGPTAVLEFNPEHGEAGKPDWLRAEVAATAAAIQEWISFKVKEIYRAANAGGQAVTESATQAQSGVALKTRFQLLNSKLAAKAVNLAEAERGILWHWLKWQNQERLYPENSIDRATDYEVEDLHADLTAMVEAARFVAAPGFGVELRKRAARTFIDHLDDRRQADILRDIEEHAAGARAVSD